MKNLYFEFTLAGITFYPFLKYVFLLDIGGECLFYCQWLESSGWMLQLLWLPAWHINQLTQGA